MAMFSSSIEDLGFVETAGEVTDANHDAHQSAKAGLFEDVIAGLSRR